MTLSNHNYLLRPLLILLLLGSMLQSKAQQFGGNPPSINWMQINSDSLRVIFPKGDQFRAFQVMNTSLYVNRHERYAIGNKFEKLNIILQPHTALSNGFVTLSPFRAVFQTTPPFDNFSLSTDNWLNELSIHETWHALQNMNFRTGLGKTFRILFGEDGQALATHVLIPDWYWEGDAVFMETKLTDQGRGRLPSFLEPFKSFYYSDRHYKFAKIRNGSLRDLIPDVYPWGYMMVAYGREKYGYDFWKKTLQESLLNRKVILQENKKHPDRPFHLFKYGFYPLAAVLRYQTGENIRTFYSAALSHFENTWEKEKQNFHPTAADTLRKATGRTVLNYRYPHVTERGRLLAVKNGYAQHPEIVRIEGEKGEDQRIVRLGNTLDPYFSYGGQKLVWAEYRPDLRWGWRNYSVLRIHDLKTGHTNTLTHKSRFYAPALSRDGNMIVTVEVSRDSESRLVLLNASNGKVENIISNPKHYSYTYPVFGNTKNIIITGARDTLGHMALIKINLRNGRQTLLTPFLPKAIGPPVNSSHYLYFPASYKEETQLFALRKKDKQLFQIAKRPLGNYSLAIDTLNQRIIFDEYTASGYQLLAMPQRPGNGEKVSFSDIKKSDPFVPKALSHGGSHAIINDVPQREYPVKPYHPLRHLIRIHSWSFLSAYPETGLYLQSRDVLNTLQVNTGGGYNFNEKAPFVDADLIYGGLFPFIQGGVKAFFNRQDLVRDTLPVRWNEVNWYSGIQVPFNLSGSLYQRQLSLSGTYHRSTLYFKKTKQIKKQVKGVSYISAGLSFQDIRNRTIQEINPKFGASLSVRWNKTLGSLNAEQLTTKLNLFLPGLFRNHSLYFTTAYSETKNRDQYKFNDNFSYAYGYQSIPYKNIYLLGANYQLPVAYPDWGLTFAYLLRIRLHLFYDYSRAHLPTRFDPERQTFRSAGATLYLDTKIFNALSIPIGIRYSRLLDRDPQAPGKKNIFNISIPINLF